MFSRELELMHLRMDALTVNRSRLAEMGVTCPSCKTEQVQLTYWLSSPATYRCRKCRFVFKVEFEECNGTSAEEVS